MKKTVLGIMLIIVVSVAILTAVFNMQFMSYASAFYDPAENSLPATSVFLTPSRINGTIAGQTITVCANVTNVTGLFCFQIGVTWSNTTVAKCTSVALGNVFSSFPPSEIISISGSINNTNGIIIPYLWSLIDGHTVTGSGTLAVFTFKVTHAGYSDVHFISMTLINVDANVIPCNIVDYFTVVRGDNQYIVKIQGNPSESSSVPPDNAGFYKESINQMSPAKTIGGVTNLIGNLTFAINGTSADNGPWGYFNVTIPNDLMNCSGNNDDWIVALNDGTGPQLQSARTVSQGATITTISLAGNFYPSGNGLYGTTVANIYSTNIAPTAFASPIDWWPMFHHDPAHSGYSTSTAPTTNQTLWTYKTGGHVDSCPAVVNGIVYVGSEDGNVYALNATTGELAWKYKTGSGVDSSPAVVNDTVYVGSEDDYVYALNATTGALLWKYKTGDAVESSPAVIGGVVYVGSDDDNVYAMNASIGTLIWNYTTYGPVHSSPALAKGMVYVSSTAPSLFVQDGITYALNASTGTLVWNYTAPNNGLKGWMTNSPVTAGGVVFVTAYYYAPTEYSLVSALNASTGASIWSFEYGDEGQSDLAIAGDVVFIGTAMNIPGINGFVLAFNASTGAFDWSNATGVDTFFSPSVAGGVVFVGGDNKVFALNASTGTLDWSRTTDGLVESAPAVADGVVYVGSDDGKVYAFGLNPIHSVTVTNIVPSKTVVGRGYDDVVNVTVANQGGFTETFNTTFYANATSIASQNMTLPVGTSATKTFVWNTLGLAYGNYTISANVTLTLGETNLWIGPLTYGTVKVTIPGDINGDGVVNGLDLHLLALYWLETVPPAPANVDIGGYGVIGGQDLHILAQHWLE